MKGTRNAVEVQRWHMQPANVRENKYPKILSEEGRDRL